MSRPRSVGRRFPDYGWAWPRADLDLLLSAVMTADEEKALQAALSWLTTHDIDDVTFREQRLLAALSDRFGRKLAASPAHPRLVGLQRLLWSRSRMALRDSAGALATLKEMGIPFMLLKGASRVAVEPGAQRGRVSHDIDILLRPSDMRAAFGALLDGGWQATSGAGPLRLLDQAATCRAMNFQKGEFGDIDIHSMAYQPVHASKDDDEGLWQRSRQASLADIPALVPAPSDRVALAIAHGALDSHAHSDWLVDIDSCIRAGDIDWQALIKTLRARRILVPAASALTYLAQEIGTPVPSSVLQELIDAADRQGLTARLALLECKPRTDFDAATAMARGLAKQVRLWRGKKASRPRKENIWRVRRVRTSKEGLPADAMDVHIPIGRQGSGEIEVVIAVDLPKARRRIDWELSSNMRHLAVLRYRKLLPFAGPRELSFKGHLTLTEGEDMLRLSARPSRFLRSSQDPDEIERYGAVPFRIVRASGVGIVATG